LRSRKRRCAATTRCSRSTPPLRTGADVEALKAGLADGAIDAIATDHAPHPVEDKERPIDDAPPGMLGLETALGVALAVLDLPLEDVVAALSWKPAAIAGVADRHGGPIAPGRVANLVVFDPDERWQVRPAALASRSRNTPYVGLELRGRVRHTVFRGAPVGDRRVEHADEWTYTATHEHPATRRPRLSRRHRSSKVSSSGLAPTRLSPGDGPVVSGELPVRHGEDRPHPERSCSTPRCRATRRCLTDPSYAGRSSRSPTPHRQLRGSTPLTSNRRGCSAGVSWSRLSRRPSQPTKRGRPRRDARALRDPGITGIDTRRLTRLIRDTGAIPGAFGPADDVEALRAAASAEPGTDGIDLVATVTTPSPYTVGTGGFRIVAYDYGIKRTILRNLAALGTVEVVPASTPAADVIARDPDGIFLSNGPGDPAEVAGATEILGALLGTGIPIFGICLGNQLLARALGGETVKLPFGHHGTNHRSRTSPRVRSRSRRRTTTSRSPSTHSPGVADLTHVNLNDGVSEGLAARDANAFSVQHHPEAAPGPHDSRYLFTRFLTRMETYRSGRNAQLSGVAASMPPPHRKVGDGEPAGLPEPAAGVA
jgi:carbamoyl-phosphate synthase small subunit